MGGDESDPGKPLIEEVAVDVVSDVGDDRQTPQVAMDLSFFPVD